MHQADDDGGGYFSPERSQRDLSDHYLYYCGAVSVAVSYPQVPRFVGKSCLDGQGYPEFLTGIEGAYS